MIKENMEEEILRKENEQKQRDERQQEQMKLSKIQQPPVPVQKIMKKGEFNPTKDLNNPLLTMEDFMKMFNQMPKMDQKRQLDDLDETNKKKKKNWIQMLAILLLEMLLFKTTKKDN